MSPPASVARIWIIDSEKLWFEKIMVRFIAPQSFMNTIGHVFAHHAARLIIPLSSTLLETAWSTEKTLARTQFTRLYTQNVSGRRLRRTQMTEFGRLKRLKRSH